MSVQVQNEGNEVVVENARFNSKIFSDFFKKLTCNVYKYKQKYSKALWHATKNNSYVWANRTIERRLPSFSMKRSGVRIWFRFGRVRSKEVRYEVLRAFEFGPRTRGEDLESTQI